MQSLLRWGIEHSSQQGDGGQPAQPIRNPRNLDPAIIDHILGKPDAELMKEALAIAVDETRDEDERIQALDNFEMLIEHIDNANDLVKLRMWEPLQSLLTAPSSTDAIKRQLLWIIGTAVQNNPAAQSEYLALSPLPSLLSFLSPSANSSKTRAKAVYALSGLLKHSAPAVKALEEAGGWQSLKTALEDSDIAVRRKTAFLLNTLLIPTESTTLLSNPVGAQGAPPSSNTAVIPHPSVHSPDSATQTVHPNSHASMLSNPSSYSTSPLTRRALEEHGLLEALVSSLISPVPHGPNGESEGDAEFEEKVLGALRTYLVGCNGRLPPEQRKALSLYVQQESDKVGDSKALADKWDMTLDELGNFKRELEQ